MKFLKIGLYIVLGFVGITAIGAGIFVVTFDANQYKPQIHEQVKLHTGRDLSLGDIRPSIFPWLGIELQQLSLSNAKGFGAKEMLTIDRLDVRVALLPLLKREIRVDTLRVHGLQLFLAKNAQGVTSWQDILDKQLSTDAAQKTPDQSAVKSAEQIPAETITSLSALLISSIEIKDANVSWDDAVSKQSIAMQAFNLETGAIRLGQPLDLKLNFQVLFSEPEATLNITAQTQVEFNAETQNLKLNGLKLGVQSALDTMDISRVKIAVDADLNANLRKQTFVLPAFVMNINAEGKAIPGEKITTQIKGNAYLDLQQQTAQVKQLSIETAGVRVESELMLSQLLDAPAFNGKVKLLPFNPSELLNSLAIQLPGTQNSNALQQAALAFDVSGNNDSIQLKALSIQLDKSSIEGELEVQQFENPVIKYQLMLDTITLDDYLPPAEKTAATTSLPGAAETSSEVATKSDVPIDLPVELIRSLNVNGIFSAREIQAFDQRVKNLKIKAMIKNGVANVPLIQAQLLDGKVVASAQLDVRKDTPKYQLNMNAIDLQADSVVSPLLQDISGEKSLRLNGALKLNLGVHSKGQSVNQLIANSNGQFKIDMGQSVLHGLDAEYFVRKAVTAYLKKKKYAVPADWQGEYTPKETTALNRAHASATIHNGVVSNKDLLIDSSRFKITGAGDVNLPGEQLNYRAVVDVNPSRTKTAAERLLDIPMPIFVTGHFSQPAINIDEKVWLKSVSNALKVEAKQEVKQAIKKEEEKQKEKLKQKTDEKLDELKDKYKDKLKGLFN